MRYRWIDRLTGTDWQHVPGRLLTRETVLESCLRGRGIQVEHDAERFLNPRLQSLGDPFDFPAMDPMVRRLQQARDGQETLVLFGDYDVDGVTATALLHEVLTRLGWRVTWYLPDRLGEGYGLTRESLRRCWELHGARLILAVDCGANAGGLIQEWKSLGVEVLVVDHHQTGEAPPPADGFLHPDTLPNRNHPARHLCSAGLAFKLAHGLVKAARRVPGAPEASVDLRSCLDLVALGTVADLVPLIEENRILVAAGLRQLAATRRCGLKALLQVSRTPAQPGVGEIGFQLAPRLNAAGRLDSAREALELLLTAEWDTAIRQAEQLDRWNRERQDLERRIASEVIERVEAGRGSEEPWVLVQGDDRWHLGVVGIVASRLVRQFHRPAIVLGGDGREGTVWRGSGRSIEGFDLASALSECGDLLERSGGHAMAAGLSLRRERLEEFRQRLNEVAKRRLRSEQLTPTLRLDGEMKLGQVDLDLLAELGRLEPLGQGNPAPSFGFCNVQLARPTRRIGREGRHVRMVIAQGNQSKGVIWWGAGDAEMPDGEFDLAAQPQINEFNGERKVELRLMDWRPSAVRRCA